MRLLLVMLVAAGTGAPLQAATTSSKGKKSSTSASKSGTAAKKSAPSSSNKSGSSKSGSSKSEDEVTPAKKKTPPPEPVNEDPPTLVPTPAVVSTLSIEDISGFDSYPKQIQSLVQSCLALTHLELGYLYGSSEPSKGGMDCSGTIYHVLHFQGLKDVPRQSDEMCQWVDKKTHLYLTPTATNFDSEEFANLKPGDLLFWTSTTETTRKLPVTHVMVYLGKLKKSGKRVVFGSSDGRSYMGERRSGVSVFDFSLPRPESTKHFYGYGPTPGLLPVEPERPVIAAMTPAAAPKEVAVTKETVEAQTPSSPLSKDAVTVKETASSKDPVALKKSSKPKEMLPDNKETRASKTTVAVKEPSASQETPAQHEEVRKAIAVSTDTPTASSSDSKTEVKKTTVANAPAKSTSPAKAKTSSTAKKRSTTVASSTRRRTPAQPQKSAFQQRVDQTVNSVRRFFQQ
ncbi:NlpC/P60 family protein [Prosthecobacter sp.]|uniref:NlpC/P60 family protein n=1 Tax=Prosthecobacter sp. TaxID=1965333 RepID=UPI003782EA5D